MRWSIGEDLYLLAVASGFRKGRSTKNGYREFGTYQDVYLSSARYY
jgi:hypothetical protein